MLSRQQKTSFKHNDGLYVSNCIATESQEPSTIPLVHKIIFKKIVALKQNWDNLFKHNFADLGHVFAQWVN